MKGFQLFKNIRWLKIQWHLKRANYVNFAFIFHYLVSFYAMIFSKCNIAQMALVELVPALWITLLLHAVVLSLLCSHHSWLPLVLRGWLLFIFSSSTQRFPLILSTLRQIFNKTGWNTSCFFVCEWQLLWMTAIGRFNCNNCHLISNPCFVL